MKRFLLLSLLTAAATMQAQDSRQLQEVVVSGARTVELADRKVIYPTRQQLATSASGYSLLSKLALPHIRIDEVAHTVTALSATGGVEVRINDLRATTDDLLSMDLAAVESVEFIDSPGVRYGDGYIINIKVRRPTSGYVVGTTLTPHVTQESASGTAYGRVNVGKSELCLTYSAHHNHDRGASSTSEGTYLLPDGQRYDIRRQADSDNRDSGHSLQLSYSLSDSDYVFQARLSGSQPLRPTRQHSTNQYTENQQTHSYQDDSHSRSSSPVLDLYFNRDLRRHQTLTANTVLTYIGTSSHTEHNEGAPYAYDTRGRTYTLWSEALYENRLRPFTLSAGVQYAQSYSHNVYSGDAQASNGLHTSGLYGFAQLKGHLLAGQRLGYVAGFGLSRRYFSEGATHQDYVLCRPKLSLAYRLGDHWRLKYDFELSRHVSQIALVSRVAIKQNAMETLVGNPDLRPNRVASHDLHLTRTTPRLELDLQAYCRQNHHCNMPLIVPTASAPGSALSAPGSPSLSSASSHGDDLPLVTTPFIVTQTNQRGCHFFFLQPYVRYDIVPDHLSATAYCGFYRFFNLGDDYTHTYNALNGAAWLQAYLGRWTLTAYADNGYHWMEGENRGYQGAHWQLNASYQPSPALTLTVYCQRPFAAHPVSMRSELLNRYIHNRYTATNSNDGNAVALSLTWHLSRGRQYRQHQRTMSHQDTETGIMK